MSAVSGGSWSSGVGSLTGSRPAYILLDEYGNPEKHDVLNGTEDFSVQDMPPSLEIANLDGLAALNMYILFLSGV